MSFSVMPDLSLRLDSIEIRHPETLENTGFRLSPEIRIFIKTVVYGQTLIIKVTKSLPELIAFWPWRMVKNDIIWEMSDYNLY